MSKINTNFYLDKHIHGVYHTGLVAFGNEWFFGNDGINCCKPVIFEFDILRAYKIESFKINILLQKGTILGEPNKMIELGKIDFHEEEFLKILQTLSETSYKYFPIYKTYN